MNKRFFNLLLIMVALCNITHIYGQDTFYYKLTKKIQKGIAYTNTAGGQFITFSGNKCYDSDKYGISVGNGELSYDKQYSTANTKTYVGSSYFGNVLYRFKSDLSVLNVEVNSSLIYVYKRQVAPSSVTTCSLIRKKGSSGSNVNGYIPVYSGTSGYAGSYNTTTINNTPCKNATTTNNRQPTKHTCSLCHGQKRIVKDTYPALYGTTDYKVRCNECGGYFLRSMGHTHITCPQCHGRGYFMTD